MVSGRKKRRQDDEEKLFVGAKKLEDVQKGGPKRELDTMTTGPGTRQEQTGMGRKQVNEQLPEKDQRMERQAGPKEVKTRSFVQPIQEVGTTSSHLLLSSPGSNQTPPVYGQRSRSQFQWQM